jgi:hypothetical protein
MASFPKSANFQSMLRDMLAHSNSNVAKTSCNSRISALDNTFCIILYGCGCVDASHLSKPWGQCNCSISSVVWLLLYALSISTSVESKGNKQTDKQYFSQHTLLSLFLHFRSGEWADMFFNPVLSALRALCFCFIFLDVDCTEEEKEQSAHFQFWTHDAVV